MRLEKPTLIRIAVTVLPNCQCCPLSRVCRCANFAFVSSADLFSCFPRQCSFRRIYFFVPLISRFRPAWQSSSQITRCSVPSPHSLTVLVWFKAAHLPPTSYLWLSASLTFAWSLTPSDRGEASMLTLNRTRAVYSPGSKREITAFTESTRQLEREK